MVKSKAIQEFQTIPGVGIKIAQDLFDLGYRKLSDLKEEDPDVMYDRLCKLQKVHVDRCMLYVFRCAVYFVSESEPDRELLKWWNWSDSKIKKR